MSCVQKVHRRGQLRAGSTALVSRWGLQQPGCCHGKSRRATPPLTPPSTRPGASRGVGRSGTPSRWRAKELHLGQLGGAGLHHQHPQAVPLGQLKRHTPSSPCSGARCHQAARRVHSLPSCKLRCAGYPQAARHRQQGRGGRYRAQTAMHQGPRRCRQAYEEAGGQAGRQQCRTPANTSSDEVG
jgi:hypothetical protein